ncbi:MAG: 2-oxo acid dehydrogenase subunit E2 [Actinobacteria bacterium]|nr:2-oxo acid dehydrogenase subunit E2 [Actinomycetota bacterium]
MHEVIMPKLGLTMETGVIEKWHKKEGDKVEAGEVLFEVMTDKVSLEVEAYNSGIVRKIIRAEGEEVPVTEVIAYIGSAGEAIPEAKETIPARVLAQAPRGEIKISPLARNIAENKGIDISKITGTGPGGRIVKEDVEAYVESGSMEAPGQPKPAAAGSTESTERLKISPLARSLAKEMGIDYLKESIAGTGPGGRIVKEDITAFAEKLKSSAGAQRAATSTAPAVPSITIPGAAATAITTQVAGAARADGSQLKVKSTTPLKGIRKVIAVRMTLSMTTIPHITLTIVVEVDNLIKLRERLKGKIYERFGAKITYTDFIIKASASVLAEQPVINSSLQENNHIIYDDINIGLAVATDAGLIVPTIYNADKISLYDIARKRVELIEKSKQGKLTMEEITNGTFTISNQGMLGIRTFTAIINPPQAAIMMVGEIYAAPAVVDGRIEAKSFIEISLAVDHRIIDGAVAAIFLQKFGEYIKNPELLLI